MVYKYIIKRENDNQFLASADETVKLAYPCLKYTFQPISGSVLTFDTEEEAIEVLDEYKQNQNGLGYEYIHIIKILG